jgi:hypothetical protein
MNKLASTTTMHHSSIITKLIEDCYNESDIDNNKNTYVLGHNY